MLTNIEVQTLEAVKRAALTYTHQQEEDRKGIDWEQRRYEIAKEVLPQCMSVTRINNPQRIAESAVVYADALIEKLKSKEQ